MFKDIHGFDCWIDLEGRKHTLVKVYGSDKCFSYENILKNMDKLSPWNTFNIKIYKDDGTLEGSYQEMTPEEPFKIKCFRKIAGVYNPELLI